MLILIHICIHILLIHTHSHTNTTHTHVCKQWLGVMVYKTYVALPGGLLSAIMEGNLPLYSLTECYFDLCDNYSL